MKRSAFNSDRHRGGTASYVETRGMIVTQVQLVAALSDVAATARTPDVGGVASIPTVDIGDPSNQTKESERLSNPAELSGAFLSGIQDLLKRSDHINTIVGEDFLKAQARVEARANGRAVAMPGANAVGPSAGMSGLMDGGMISGGGSIGGMTGMSPVLPGPAARHPGAGPSGIGAAGAEWDEVQDLYDRAFIRYTEFSAYQLQSSELNKITDQLSNAINTLVRAS